MLKKLALSAAFAVFILTPFSAHALDADKAESLVETQISSWLNNPIVVDAIKAQNEAHTALNEDEIIALDQKWRAGDTGLINATLSNALSQYLQNVVEQGGGLYSEIFVMDNKGLNVGQSAKTSDYWQGDEAKWQKTYGSGHEAMHLGDVEFDESSQTYQVQLSTTVSDGGTVIGAVTIGLDAEAVE